ncbi:MAG: hypothetical protein HGA65_06790, partial [Oscillochloris sp.]|nr:hypothetical protein [Oscillochloris sp.]
MSIAWLLDLVFADPPISLDDIARAIETRLAPELLTREVLEQVRHELRRGSEDEVLRAMLVSARYAPVGVATALATYGMWLARRNLHEVKPDLLRVAAWAYHWADDQIGRGRAMANLAAALHARDDFATAEQDARAALAIFEREELPLGIVKSHLIIGSIAYERQEPERIVAIGAKLLRMLDEGDIVDQEQYIDTLLLLGVTAEDLKDDFKQAQAYYLAAGEHIARVADPTAYAFRLNLNLGYVQMRLGRYGDARQALAEAEQSMARGRATSALSAPDDYDLRLAQLQHAMLVNDRARALGYLLELNRLQSEGEDSPKQRAEITLFSGLLETDTERGLRQLEAAAEAFLAPALHMELLGVTVLTYLAERAYQAGKAVVGQQAIARARTLLEGYRVPRRRLDLERIAAHYDSTYSVAERERVADDLEQEGDYLGGAAVWSAIGAGHERAGNRSAAAVAYDRAIHGIEMARGMGRLSLQPTHPLDLATQIE